MIDSNESEGNLNPDNPHQVWSRLEGHYLSSQLTPLKQTFINHPDRAKDFFLQLGKLSLDYSKNHINKDIIDTLISLAQSRDLQKNIKALFAGDNVNESEGRAALHMALRNPDIKTLKKPQLTADIKQTLARMKDFSEAVIAGKITGARGNRIEHLLHIGIGGSYLGPRMLDEALSASHKRQLSCDYLANIDGNQVETILNKVNPENTLVIVASKSFTTLETKLNADTVKEYFLKHMTEEEWQQHLLCVTASSDKAHDFGVKDDYLFPTWESIGGRYSLWSAMGLPLCLTYGYETFSQILEGASEMDQHFLEADLDQNMPVIMSLISIWYSHFFNTSSQAVVPYDHSLRLFPAHLQQLVMESNGKSVKQDGTPVSYSTSPVVWGGEGTNGQHAFHQLLHQGTEFIPVDFILPLSAGHDRKSYQDQMVANCLGQALALMNGLEKESIKTELIKAGMDETAAETQSKHQSCPGNRPSNVILLQDLSADALGMLVALYEHKVFCEAVMWQINPFDQWGVELGKNLGKEIVNTIQGDGATGDLDASTLHLLSLYQDLENQVNIKE